MSEARIAHSLVKEQKTQIETLLTSIGELQNALDESNSKVVDLTMQLTLLGTTLQYEKDSNEFVLLRSRKHDLASLEVVRYCQLYRTLSMGSNCDL